jgi:hypothetical protein
VTPKRPTIVPLSLPVSTIPAIAGLNVTKGGDGLVDAADSDDGFVTDSPEL